jgi:hypothetical protein
VSRFRASLGELLLGGKLARLRSCGFAGSDDTLSCRRKIAPTQRRTCTSLKAVPKVLSDLNRVMLNVIRQADGLLPVPNRLQQTGELGNARCARNIPLARS